MGNKVKNYLSIGYSGNINDLKSIITASNNIYSVYTGGLPDKIRGGRPQYIDNLSILSEQISLAHNNGILYEIALNSPCGLEDKANRTWWRDIVCYIKELENIGVDAITASHPFIMEIVKKETKLKLSASTICEVSSARQALYYEEMGADVIIPSMNMNYNIKGLIEIKTALKRAEIKIMVNEHCLGDCPWRRFHHNHYSHSDTEVDYHFNCKALFLKKPYLLMTNNCIRPEDILKYKEITNHFKIVGRLVPINDLVERITAYSNCRFTGNYVSLFDSQMSKHIYIPNEGLEKLYSKKSECNKLCDDCGYCISLYSKIAN